MNLAKYLPEGSIITQAQPDDWRDSIRLAGDALVAQGVATEQYTEEMISAVEQLGPYIVIAPGFALAHARPSESVLKTGISWVSLANPIEFGSKDNDPVRLIVGLAARDHEAHIDIMSALAGILDNDDTLDAAISADTPDKVREVLSMAAKCDS